MNKGMTQTISRGVEYLVTSYSKAALADLVVDLVRLNIGDETVEGRSLRSRRDAMRPIAEVRGDRHVDPDAFVRFVERRAANGYIDRDTADTVLADWYNND